MLEDKLKRICVVGTGTDVGKSVLSLLLMRYFTERGHRPLYLKPFQTGCASPSDTAGDARFIYDHLPAFRGKDPADATLFCYREPKAPWFAARNEGRTATLAPALAAIEEKAGEGHAPLIIEGAGGILVPINAEETMLDLIVRSGSTPVVAAAAGLGTINHTLLTLEVLASRGIRPAGVVMMNGTGPDVSEEMIAENMEAIENGSGIAVAGVIGRIDDFSAPFPHAEGILNRLFS